MTEEIKPSKQRRYIKRASVLLTLAEELTRPTHVQVTGFRGRTVAHLHERLHVSRATIYRFFEDLRALGLSLLRNPINGGVRYSLPPGSVHQLAIRLARIVVCRTGVTCLLDRFDEAIGKAAK